jgi:uncharacterized membrane protein YsdA (DUF1294 family)
VNGLLVAYLVLANLVSFAMFGIDKSRARKNERRISEKALIGSALASGTIGGWAAMYTFRHKTAKRSFQVKMALASAVDAAIAIGAFLLLR